MTMPEQSKSPVRHSKSPASYATSSTGPSRHASLGRRSSYTHGANDDEASRTSAHPLVVDVSDAQSPAYHGDVSRPTLRRLTSETERHVAESSSASAASHSEGSTRGSVDLLRMSPAEESKEVEVLVHHVKSDESLAGIALLYGIDLPTLRRVNKLWASDSVHLRTVLYVPIEACRWNKASETFVRGPGPGQITLVPKHASAHQKGKAPVCTPAPASSATDDDEWGSVSPARTYIDTTNIAYDSVSRVSVESIRPSGLSLQGDETPAQRVVDVVRMPSSQLCFFPKRQPPPESRRTSMEQDMRRVSLERGLRRSVSLRYTASEDGPSIQNDLSTLPRPLQPKDRGPDAAAPKSSMVKIRPPTTLHASTGSIADRLTHLFAIPPPPDDDPRFSPSSSAVLSKPRHSADSAFSSKSTRSSGSPAVSLEMHPRPKGKNVKPNKKTD